jgi:hypothetical protein
MSARGNLPSFSRLVCEKCGKSVTLEHDGCNCECGGIYVLKTLEATSMIHPSPKNKSHSPSRGFETLGSSAVVR